MVQKLEISTGSDGPVGLNADFTNLHGMLNFVQINSQRCLDEKSILLTSMVTFSFSVIVSVG